MLSPSRSAPVVEPGKPPPAPRSSLRAHRAALVLGVVALLSALAFPFAPVHQPEVAISWPSAAGSGPATAIPLMPYQPISLTASVPCEAAQAAAGAPGETVLLSTVPLDPDPQAPVLPGLRISVLDGTLLATSYGQLVAEDPVPAAGGCEWTLRSTPTRTALDRDGERLGALDADARPGVAGIFTEAPGPSGMNVRIIADTRFQTSISTAKVALAVLCVASLAGALLAARAMDRSASGRTALRLLPARWWRPRAVDLLVTAALGLWALIGPISVDDGYIAGIVRSRGSNGFSGNVYRWLNAPEAPFSYFYELYALWSSVTFSPLWMRIPSVLLGLLTWFALSRLLLPRLGVVAGSPSTRWTAAAVFLLWWLPFNLGMRPEPWVAAGTIAVFCLVERGVASRRLLPLLIGLVVVGATVAVTPTGIIATAPFLAALFPVVRVVRARTDVSRLTLAALVLAAGSSALLLMFPDQTFASVAESTRVRTLIGGGLPWYQEYARYAELLNPDNLQGALQLRVPVLLGLAALVGLAWALRRGRVLPGVAVGPARRVGVTVALALALMTFTPTKWTTHFGALAGVGSALLVLALYAWSRAGVQATSRNALAAVRLTAAGIAVVAVAASLSLAGLHQYPYISNFGITWSTLAPVLLGYPIYNLALVGGLLLAGGLVAWSAWRVAGGNAPSRVPRWVPSPATLTIVFVVATIVLQLGSFSRAAVERRDTYTVAEHSIDTLTGTSCGLADELLVEPDPGAGLLTPLDTTAVPDGFVPNTVPTGGAVPLRLAGQLLPGWVGVSAGDAGMTTGWFRLTEAQRSGELPLVTTVSGEFGDRDLLLAEFGTTDGTEVTPVVAVGLPDQLGTPEPRDVRITPPAGEPDVDVVRLVAASGGEPGEVPLSFSAPRSPQLMPMNELIPPGATAILDWPVAFQFPCVRFAALPQGTAEIPEWRLTPPIGDDAGDISITPRTGGPFVTPRMLVTEERIPVYLRNDLLRDAAGLKRWAPITELGRPGVDVRSTVEPGWERIGRATVPTLDDR